ncbi:MAG: class I SAM-dependent methyltransferase [Gammaproteobacteria bacterium]|nr:class I SAM-dependent methyltransferase [Gammaproteobacteria bacterium]
MKANTSRRSRFAFGHDPNAYDRGRMSFSPWIVDWALDTSRFQPGHRVLEIGAGTGQLTVELLAAGANLTALEPSDNLADLLQNRYTGGDIQTFEIVRETFEDYVVPHQFPLVAAANSFHWLDPAISYRKASEILDTDGRLCLFWYFPILADSDVQDRVNSIVREAELEDLVREPVGYSESLKEVLAEGRNEVDESGYLRCRDWMLKPRSILYSVDEYVDLATTYASSKNVSELRDMLKSSVFHTETSVELVVYEYVCIAARS